MQVRSIGLMNLMRYTKPVELLLPPVGLILITGQNGAGKSTFVEAVSYAGWGKTLRGTDPRIAGESGQASIALGFGMEVTRRWTSGMRNVLDVELQDKAFEFDTPTKAQDHVTSVLGEWDTWRRSCAFSSVDDLSFATATDAERKRLLESLLGLSRFDRAQELCRVQAKAANWEHTAATQRLAHAQSRLAATREGLGALETMAASAAPTADLASLRARLETVQSNLPIRQANHRDERESHQAAVQGQANHTAQVNQAKRALQVLDNTPAADACPSCGQTWPDAAARLNHREVQRIKLQHELQALLDSPHKGADPERLKAAEEALRTVQNAISQLTGELAQAERDHKRYQDAQSQVKTAKINILDMEDVELSAQADVAQHAYALRHLDTTDLVLGTKGARAHMLVDALTGMEAVANLWLERIARTDAPLKLHLSPYTEKKTGGTADSISLEVEGAGGGRGYRAASGGERRRIDVAIMLALAEVAQAADGRVSPTMFFDEVFDSLDRHGVEAVARTLDQLAQDRCIVVMSHNEELISNLVPDMRLHVADGKVEHR